MHLQRFENRQATVLYAMLVMLPFLLEFNEKLVAELRISAKALI
jgi:hypothetical protein